MAELVVLAAGNDARGDDALGPLLLARLAALAVPEVRTVFDFQFQVEHALDLEGADAVLFVDAHCAQADPARLERLVPALGVGGASHALSPAEVLTVARRIGNTPPPAWLLSLGGTSFGLGEGLSTAGAASLEAGWVRLRDFVVGREWQFHGTRDAAACLR